MKQGYIIHFKACSAEGTRLYEGNRSVVVVCGRDGFVDPRKLLHKCTSRILAEYEGWRGPEGRHELVNRVIIVSVMKL